MIHQAFHLLSPNLGVITHLEGQGVTFYLRGWVGRRAIPFGRVRYILGNTGEETELKVDGGEEDPPENHLG